MNLLICLITHNRLDYTKKTLASLIDTIGTPHFIVAVDNASTDGTAEWLQSEHDKGRINYVVLNDKNYYPGAATNVGWDIGLAYYPEATHLMRLDNDINFYPNWSQTAELYFGRIDKLGQLGLDNGPMESEDAQHFWQEHNGMEINPYPGNVGGPNIIRRELWDYGLRYEESVWGHATKEPTPQEDTQLSLDISNLGWLFGHPKDKLAYTIDKWEDYPEYFIKTLTERGYEEVFKDKIQRLKELADD